MILVKTKLKEIEGKGIGLFAAEFIPNGTIWWKDTPLYDKIISKEEYDSYDLIQKEFCDKYIFIKKDGTMYMCIDNARFINHSDKPNTGNTGEDCLAIRDIQEGEELTCDYRDICITCVNGLPFENHEK